MSPVQILSMPFASISLYYKRSKDENKEVRTGVDVFSVNYFVKPSFYRAPVK